MSKPSLFVYVTNFAPFWKTTIFARKAPCTKPTPTCLSCLSPLCLVFDNENQQQEKQLHFSIHTAQRIIRK